MTNQKKQKALSKTLSWILRHGIIELGLLMRDDGYVKLNDVLGLDQLKQFTAHDVYIVVESSDKQRFSLTVIAGIEHIRANQGHCDEVGKLIDDDKLLQRQLEKLPMCFHGTTNEAYKLIKQNGLSPMGRKHIHLASGYPKDKSVKSGIRNTSNVIIHINMQKALEVNKRFYISDNGVILSPDHLEPELFSKVEFK